MLPALLETLQFRSENRFQPVIEALEVIPQHLRHHAECLPSGVAAPVDGVVTPKWREKVLGEEPGQLRVNRRYYELCVLKELEKALQCKEVWVRGSYAFRNPKQDLPGDWNDEARRARHDSELGKSQDAAAFMASLKQRLTEALERAWIASCLDCATYAFSGPTKGKNGGCGRALARLEPQPEAESLGWLKGEIHERYGLLDLLDVLVEADRIAAFTRGDTRVAARTRDRILELKSLYLLLDPGQRTGRSPIDAYHLSFVSASNGHKAALASCRFARSAPAGPPQRTITSARRALVPAPRAKGCTTEIRWRLRAVAGPGPELLSVCCLCFAVLGRPCVFFLVLTLARLPADFGPP